MIRYLDANCYEVVEPRIAHIKRDLERLLSLIQLEKAGEPVIVDGFRLRNLSSWAEHEISSAWNAVVPISGVCNSKCTFCFEQGIPFARERSLISEDEARTRLKFYSAVANGCLFPSARPHMEPFIHPKALELIELARAHDPHSVFWITTNGSYLDDAVVQRLASLQPIMIKLSLNASDPEEHEKLMRLGKRTEICINAPCLLEKYQVPFIGSVVAWPSIPFETLSATVSYLDGFRPYAIRLRLPLSHKWLKSPLKIDFEDHWRRTADFARHLSERCAAPLLVDPTLFYINSIIPEIDGIVLNSPAHDAGLRRGDVIRSINGRSVITRAYSERLLTENHRKSKPVDIVISRDRTQRSVHLELAAKAECYPYEHRYFFKGENYGIIHAEDLDLAYIENMVALIEKYNAHDVLLFTSSVSAPVVETVLNVIQEFANRLRNINVYVDSIKETLFGGNFHMLECRMVEDYLNAVDKRLDQGLKPDLILIPKAFGTEWGIDLLGESFSTIAIRTGIPVEQIDWPLIYGRDV